MLRVRNLAEEGLRDRANAIYGAIKRSIPIKTEDYSAHLVGKEYADPFRVLVVTILSQSCTDINALRAFRRLEERIGVKPEALAISPQRKIEAAIRVAGLQRQKSRAIKALSKVVAKKGKNLLSKALREPLDEARKMLMGLPQVGPKTADVLLSVFGRPTVPVDTHVARVSKRLGLVGAKATYEGVRTTLMRLFGEEAYPELPLLFMALGRKVCKARRPLCPICPVNELCDFPRKSKTLG